MHTSPVLVTGGTGFVGSHVVEQLLRDGHRVRCHVRRGRTSLGWLSNLPVEIVEGDIASSTDRLALLRDVGTIIHIAGVTKARSLEAYRAVNVDMTRALLETSVAHGAGRFVLISSLAAVGPSTDGSLPDELTACLPLTSYGISKLEAENVCRSYADRIGVTILRPPAVYGPRDKDILEMFRYVSLGLRPVIGSRSKTLSLVHVQDLASAVVRTSLDPRAAGKTYFVSDPEPYKFSDLIGSLARIMDRRTFPLYLPAPVLYAAALGSQAVSALLGRTAVLTIEKARDLLQPAWVCSSRALSEDLGVRSSIPIEQGLRETYAWYRSHGWLS